MALLLFAGAAPRLTAAETPLSFAKENTAADCAKPPLPEFSSLQPIRHLPDPFTKANGNRITTRDEWRCQRAEIKSLIERYGVGIKPGKPSTFKASLQGDTIIITVGEGTNTFEMTATINRPANAPDTPIPAIIGINSPTGSLPRDPFSLRGIATITYRASQVAPTAFGGITYASGNFTKLYPDSDAGYMIRWAWGISRIIDALEMLPEARIDLSRLAVTGCSFQGKIGALCRRI